MKSRALSLRIIARATLILFAATSERAQVTASAKSFVQQIYAEYSNSDWQHEAGRQTKFYSRSLNRMIVADAERHPDEISNLDFDMRLPASWRSPLTKIQWIKLPTKVFTGTARTKEQSQRRAFNLIPIMVSNYRPTCKDRHAAELIMARRIDLYSKAEIRHAST